MSSAIACGRCGYPKAEHEGPCERGWCRCGTLTDHIVEVSHNGVIREAHVCRPCFWGSIDGVAPWRTLFERLLAMGATRDAANRIVSKRIAAHFDRLRTGGPPG